MDYIMVWLSNKGNVIPSRALHVTAGVLSTKSNLVDHALPFFSMGTVSSIKRKSDTED